MRAKITVNKIILRQVKDFKCLRGRISSTKINKDLEENVTKYTTINRLLQNITTDK